MYNIEKGCDKIMVMNWVLEKPREYGAIDYDGLWKKLIFELFEEFVLFFAADLYEEIDFLKEPEFLQRELFQEIIHEKIPIELTQKLRNEIILSKEEIELMYLDRKNLPLTFGELIKLERKEGREEGREEGQRNVAKSMLEEGFPIELIVKLTGLPEEAIRNL